MASEKEMKLDGTSQEDHTDGEKLDGTSQQDRLEGEGNQICCVLGICEVGAKCDFEI